MLVVIDATAARTGGLATYARSLASAWDDSRRLEPLFVTTAEFDLGTTAVGQQRTRYLGGTAASRLMTSQLEVRRVLREQNADVLYSLLPVLPHGPLRLPTAALVHDLRHELLPSEFGSRARLQRSIVYKHAYRSADLLIAISERTRRDLWDRHPNVRRVEVVLSGADHRPLPARDGRAMPYALTYAHHSNKNPDGVLRAVAHLADTHGLQIPLKVVGCSPVRATQLRGLAAQLGISNLVSCAPPLDEVAYALALGRCAMVVLNSTFEGFGLPVLEALRAGLPCVTSPDAALLEVGGSTIFAAVDWSHRALAHAIYLAWLQRDDVVQVVARRAHAERFTWARAVTQTQEHLLTLVPGGTK